MGAGASSMGGEREAAKWNGLVTELESLCKSQRASLHELDLERLAGKQGKTRPPLALAAIDDNNTAGEHSPVKRRSSILKKESNIERRRHSQDVEITPIRRTSSVVSFQDKHLSISPRDMTPQHALSPTMQSLQSYSFEESVVKKSRATKNNVRKTRKEYFAQYFDGEHQPVGGINCHHLGLVCAALSYLLSMKNGNDRGRVTLEDIFFSTHLPLHYAATESFTLAEMYDICKEFIDHDPRFRDNVRVEVCFTDTSLVDGDVEPGERANESGDRGPPTLATFRKTLEEDCSNLDACQIFCFDPFVAEQAKIAIDDTDSDDDTELAVSNQKEMEATVTSRPGSSTTAQAAPSHTHDCLTVYKPGDAPKSKYGAENLGWFSLCVDFNSVMHTLSLADSLVDIDVCLRPNQVPLTAMYRACCTKDSVTNRKRGFIRFSLIEAAPLTESETIDVRHLYCPDLTLGVGKRGIPLISVHESISKHLIAFAYAIHLVQGLVDDDAGVGIDTRSLSSFSDFPLNIMLDNEMSLTDAYAYFDAFLSATEMKYHSPIKATIHPIVRKVDNDEAPPTMSIMEFQDVLIQATEESNTNRVMILHFDLGAAHSVLNLAAPGTSHFGILMAYDSEKQLVRVLDVEPKKYQKVWTTTLQRLHRSMIGKGYIMVYQVREEYAGDEIQQIVLKRQDSVVRRTLVCAAAAPLPKIPRQHLHFFEFPDRPMPVTLLAIALNVLRKDELVLVKDVLHAVPCDPSFLVDEAITVNELERIAIAFFLKNETADRWSAQAVNFDDVLSAEAEPKPRVAFDDFAALLRKADAREESLIFHCDKNLVSGGGELASVAGGLYAMFLELNDDVVTISTASPTMYSRFITVPLAELYASLRTIEPLNSRARGYLRIEKKPLPAHYSAGRKVDLFDVPQWQQFRVPQCVHLNAVALALTHFGHPCSAEDVFYTSYTCLGGERFRRGSAIFPWHQLKISLGELSERMTVTAVAKMVMKFELATNHRLTAATIIAADREDFEATIEESCSPQASSLLLAVIRTENVFGIHLSDEEAHWKVGCGVLKHYDKATGIVSVVDANSTRYGCVWTCTLQELYEAADLSSAADGDNGLVKIGKSTFGLAPHMSHRKSVVATEFTAF
ncbi:hypothetical protein DIPPA_16509 [Diplonema papillatum]|nr:hypothetical protein DIPPA_16509 [Diplonema papillatum]